MKKQLSVWLGCLLTSWVQAMEVDTTSWRGSWQQGGLVYGYIDPSLTLKMDDQSVPVATDGLFVVGFGRDAADEVVFTMFDGEKKGRHY